VIGSVLIGAEAGVVAGMLGVGGGILFVPALVIFLDLSQVDAEATSLLAIIPVALVGAWRQHAYGNVRVRDGLLVGALAIPGAIGGVALVNELPDRTIEVGFAALMLFVAVQLARKGMKESDSRGDRALQQQ
jgi:uncharacterized membrane protein YfcA